MSWYTPSFITSSLVVFLISNPISEKPHIISPEHFNCKFFCHSNIYFECESLPFIIRQKCYHDVIGILKLGNHMFSYCKKKNIAWNGISNSDLGYSMDKCESLHYPTHKREPRLELSLVLSIPVKLTVRPCILIQVNSGTSE